MDSPPPTSETPPTTTAPNRRRALLRFLVVSISLLLVLVVLFLAFGPSNPQFVWMYPEQVTQTMKPGPLTLVESRVKNLLGPVMRYYHLKRANIMVSISIRTFSATAAGQISLKAPVHIDPDGRRAWILSRPELDAFRRQLNTNPGVSALLSPSIQTVDGMRFHAPLEQSVSIFRGVTTSRGFPVDLLANSSADSVKLLFCVVSTESTTYNNSNPAIKTNFSAACRVVLPNAGALVINCRNADPSNPANYWLIVSPVLVDATGNPIKH